MTRGSFQLVTIIIIWSLFGLSAWAQNDSDSEIPEQPVSDPHHPPQALDEPTQRNLRDDRWFFYVGTGVGRPSYDSRTDARIKAELDRGGESPFAGFVDLPGIYRRLSPQFAAGAVLNASFEHAATQWQQPHSYAIHTYNPSASVIYFPGAHFGLKWFLRGDLGASRYLEIREEPDPAAQVAVRHHDVQDGVFTQIALGYAWHASDFARLLVHANAFQSSAGDRRMSGLNLNVGFLF